MYSTMNIEPDQKGSALDISESRKQRSTRRLTRLYQHCLWACVGVFALLVLMRGIGHHFQFRKLWETMSSDDSPLGHNHCTSTPYSYKPGKLSYTFDIDTDVDSSGVEFAQHLENSRSGHWNRRIQTTGKVIVQAASSEVSDVTVDLDVRLSHDELADAIQITNDSNHLTFRTEQFLDGFTAIDPCIYVIATISVPTTANMSTFNVDVRTLSVELEDSLQLESDMMYIRTINGGISTKASVLEARHIELETVSGSITGSYPLADHLSAKSVSGTIDIEVEPKDGDEGRFIVDTKSGSIRVKTHTTSLPARKIKTSIDTVSGTVSGTYLLGVSSTLNSKSSWIDASFYTNGDISERSLVATSVSGSVQTKVYANAFKLGTVESKLESRSGTVDASFPAAWEGSITATSRTGSVDFFGDGIKIIKDTRPHYGRSVLAEKGDGSGKLVLETVTGAITARFD